MPHSVRSGAQNAPLRAAIVSRGETRKVEWPKQAISLATALDRYDAMAAKHPWLSGRPFLVERARVARYPDAGLWLLQSSGAVPIERRQHQDALALTAAGISQVAGLWDGRAFSVLAADTSFGRWHAS